MSLQVLNNKSEREQIVQLRRQSVFMFIATHLDPDGCFSGSDQYIANTVAGSNRQSVNRTRQSLEKTGDVMVVESDRYDAKGKSLPNRVRPVPIRTFWVREWIRNGSKTDPDFPRSEHGQSAVPRSRVNSLNQHGLTPQSEAPVNTDKTRAHEHKNNTPLLESPSFISVDKQSIEYGACSREHGFTKYTDPPVQRALDALRTKLAEMKAQQTKSPHNSYWGTKAEELKNDIAILEGAE